MRKILYGAAAALALTVWVVPAVAMSHAEPEPDADKTINFSGEVRARWEYTENVFDADDDNLTAIAPPGGPPPPLDDSFDLWPYRARVAADGKFADNIFGKAEIQAFGFFGDDNPEKSAQHPIGQAFDSSSDAEVSLYQAYLRMANIGGSNWSVKVGRQEYSLGNELHFGDADFYNGISFDGIRTTMDAESWDLDLFFYMIDEIPGALSFPNFDEQNELWGATVNFGIGESDQYIEPYFVINRETSNTGGVNTRTRVWMLGALWANPVTEGGAWDWSLEAAVQGGEVGTSPTKIDLGGMIGEGWLGWSFAEAHRIHVGALYASGDDDPTDTDVDSFQPLFPDEHAHNRLGDLDLFGGPSVAAAFSGASGLGSSLMSNVMDINVGYTWLGEERSFRAAVHMLTLAEEFDPDLSGPLDGEDDLGNEIDLAYDRDISQNLAFQVGYAHLLPGDLLDANFNGTEDADDVMRGWAQLRLRWN